MGNGNAFSWANHNLIKLLRDTNKYLFSLFFMIMPSSRRLFIRSSGAVSGSSAVQKMRVRPGAESRPSEAGWRKSFHQISTLSFHRSPVPFFYLIILWPPNQTPPATQRALPGACCTCKIRGPRAFPRPCGKGFCECRGSMLHCGAAARFRGVSGRAPTRPPAYRRLPDRFAQGPHESNQGCDVAVGPGERCGQASRRHPHRATARLACRRHAFPRFRAGRRACRIRRSCGLGLARDPAHRFHG